MAQALQSLKLGVHKAGRVSETLVRDSRKIEECAEPMIQANLRSQMARRRHGIRTLLGFVVSAQAAYTAFMFAWAYLVRANLCLQPDLLCDEIAGIPLSPIVVSVASFSISSVAWSVIIISVIVAVISHFADFTELHWLVRMIAVSGLATSMAVLYGAVQGALAGDAISGAFVAFVCGSVISIVGSGFLELCQRHWIVLLVLAIPALAVVVLGILQ